MNTAIEILIDVSGSMTKRMSTVKALLINDILPNLNSSLLISIKTFTAINGEPIIQSILPMNNIDKETFKKAIQRIECSVNGRTPIAASIKSSVKILSEYTMYEKAIVLITDGKETEKGDYVQEAIDATKDGINCKIHLIGIDLNNKEKTQAKEIAKITGGTSSFISYNKGTHRNITEVKSYLSNFFNAVKSPIIKPLKDEIEPKSADKLIIENSRKQEFISNDQLDTTEDTEHNERIRQASEGYLFKILKEKYPDRVKWLNENGESGQSHDFEIINPDETIEYYIECKGTVKSKPTFYLTKNEWHLFLNHTKNYQIYFVQNSFDTPNHVCIDNLLDWLLKGKLVPYLRESEIIKEGRVVLTLNTTTFDN